MCFRYDLLAEELREVDEAMGDLYAIEDLPALAKELADVLYVAYGAGVAFGIDLDKVFTEVHNSNMSKLGADGKPIFRSDNKVLKGPNYSAPDLSWIIS